MFADRSIKRMNAGALALATLVAWHSPAVACPLVRLARVTDEPLISLQHKELPLTHWESAEGGKWDVYLRPDGTLHSIIRTDFGETFQRKDRASFLSKGDFVMVSTFVRYKFPITMGPVEIASTVSARYFLCKGVVYLPATLKDESSGTQSLAEAKHLKSVFFESADIVSYLKGLK
jgi:hypothetical protein